MRINTIAGRALGISSKWVVIDPTCKIVFVAAIRMTWRQGKSLQEYLLGELIENASRPTLDEVLDRAGERAGGRLPASFAVEHLRAERASR